MAGKSIIVMGVCGSGKSSVGARLAERIGALFIDGDDLHPCANIRKMSQGIPLGDEERAPWLESVRDVVFNLKRKNQIGVIACSALKRRYRDVIREGDAAALFLFLEGSRDMLRARLNARQGHFMHEAMLDSQLAALERPADDESGVVSLSIDANLEAVVERAVQAFTEAAFS